MLTKVMPVMATITAITTINRMRADSVDNTLLHQTGRLVNIGGKREITPPDFNHAIHSRAAYKRSNNCARNLWAVCMLSNG